jgi:nucleoside 2-deoxyribosyltransferase
MKVYLAARYSRMEEMRVHAERLKASGIEVTSRWILGLHDKAPPALCASDDIEDIRSADAVVVFADDPGHITGRPSRGGKHVEFGLALGLGKPIYLVGRPENVFQHLPQVVCVKDVSEVKP